MTVKFSLRCRPICLILPQLQVERTSRALRPLVKSILAGLLATIILGSSLLAASPSLHQLFHDDPASASEVCVMCLLAHGQFDTPVLTPAIVPLVFSLLVLLILPTRAAHYTEPDLRLAPDRGPPSLRFALLA